MDLRLHHHGAAVRDLGCRGRSGNHRLAAQEGCHCQRGSRTGALARRESRVMTTGGLAGMPSGWRNGLVALELRSETK